jgi:hypothetical protein
MPRDVGSDAPGDETYEEPLMIRLRFMTPPGPDNMIVGKHNGLGPGVLVNTPDGFETADEPAVSPIVNVPVYSQFEPRPLRRKASGIVAM